MTKVKDLNSEQRNIWMLARRYAKAEMAYENADYAYRTLAQDYHLYQELEIADRKRARAAKSLLDAIAGAVILSPTEAEVLVYNSIRFGQEGNVQYPDTARKLIEEVM